MRKHTKFLTRTVVLAVASCFAACNGTIDKEPNVVLEVQTLTISPVTASQDSVLNTCTYTITAANATFKNLPKNQYASESPFNDIILQNVEISYTWDDGLIAPPRVTGLGGSVPAGGTTSAQFSVISNADLNVQGPDPNDPPGTGRSGHTAALELLIHGQTVSGDAVSTETGGTLQVNSCTTQFTGACCGGPGACSLQTQQNCAWSGGTYAGDNTSCQTTVCN
jgi:hypothetical protein